MGWDLLSGKTKLRKKLMQLLWTTKSQVLQLEESSQNGNSHKVSCVENLCDFLCYQLDLATFVAWVNSGQSWSLKSSLLSRRELLRNEVDVHFEPFVENLVLQRLSVGSPIRVLFDVVPSIRYQDAIELISMQPITSNLAAWNRMQDVELMHMRYDLESAVSALEVMGRSVADVIEIYQVALCYLKDLRNHLEAIKIIPRKILMINIIISLLHMDDLKATPLGASHSALPNAFSVDYAEAETHGEGNEMVVSFTRLLLKILQQNLPLAVPEQDSSLNAKQRQGLEWRSIHAKRFIED